MNDLNKITNTRVGDNIHYYINGKEDRGVVVKMNNAYVTVIKSDGNLHEIHINDTFFVKDILTNKTWNGMTLEERTEELQKAHAYSPRFLSKTWEQLPQELRDVLAKTNIEESTHGQIGGNRAGVSTDTDVKTPEDYKGESKDDKKEEFKHEHQEKPTVDKNNGMEEDHKKKDQFDGMKEDWRPTGGESDKQKNFLNKSEPLWKTWLDKNVPKKGGKFQPQDYVGQAIHAKNRNLGTEKPLKEYDNYDNKHGLVARTERSRGNSLTSGNRYQGSIRPSGMNRYDEDGDTKTPKVGEAPIKKSYGKPLYGVTTLDKEGDGAGNSGVTSTETTGVYNARYSDNHGRYRDQERDTDKKGEEKDDGRRSRD